MVMDQNSATYDSAATREGSAGFLYVEPAVAALRVLVVDDSEVNRKLAKLGVKADTAANGLEALAAIERVPYCLVLMDCHMPEMDGLSATRELRRQEGGGRRLPVVAMTAGAGEDLKACLEAGMDACLPKPFRRADLENVVQAWAAPVSPEAVRRISETLGGDPMALAALVQEFSESGAALTAVIRAAAVEADRGGLSLAAHALKGACLNFGARHLAYLCARMEGMSAAGQVLGSTAFADAAASEFERVRKALEALAADGLRVA